MAGRTQQEPVTANDGKLAVGQECPECVDGGLVCTALRSGILQDDEPSQRPLQVLYCSFCWRFWVTDAEAYR